MTTPTQLSAVSRTSLATLGSPPSETSAPLSSLTISVPSMAVSPSGEEERPLLMSITCQTPKSWSRDEQKRTSAHYNHGHMAHSLPPSPLFTMENSNSQVSSDHDSGAASRMLSASPEKLLNTSNFNDCSTNKAGVTNGYLQHNLEYSCNSMLVSDTGEPQWELTPYLTTDSTTALWLRAMYKSRTNPASQNDDLQIKSSCSATKKDPIAV